MGQATTAGAIAILQRLLHYGDKVYQLAALVAGIRDRRQRPRLPTARVVRCVLVMFLTRLGSLNALAQTVSHRFWKRWLAADPPSADSVGRIMEQVDPDSIRQALHEFYNRLKVNKALPPTSHGLMALAIDGHESHATYLRHCTGCLERPIKTRRGYKTQFYHRHVVAMLLGEQFAIYVDAEPLGPHEDELGAAKRLLTRVLDAYPRAFDIVLGDALYTDSQVYALVRSRGKDLLTVLKANQRDLLREAHTLLEQIEPLELKHQGALCEVCDLGGFDAWPGLDRPLRVVRSREHRRVQRQLDGMGEDLLSEWLWVTTCSPQRASTAALLRLGHARWDIENQGFNEIVNRWHADHVYKHSANAILTFWMVAMLAFNLFQAFYALNLKPEVRQSASCLHVARCMASELYHDPPAARAPPS